MNALSVFELDAQHAEVLPVREEMLLGLGLGGVQFLNNVTVTALNNVSVGAITVPVIAPIVPGV